MSAMTQSLIQELTQESMRTREALECVPADKLGWQPHAKSMTLGRLATHIATIPSGIARIVEQGRFDVAEATGVEPASSKEEILKKHDEAVAEATKLLGNWDDAHAMSPWQLLKGGQPAMPPIPRVAVVRGFLLNHLYHHRGQLSVYLRLLDVPVPSIYGPSADVNPFA